MGWSRCRTPWSVKRGESESCAGAALANSNKKQGRKHFIEGNLSNAGPHFRGVVYLYEVTITVYDVSQTPLKTQASLRRACVVNQVSTR